MKNYLEKKNKRMSRARDKESKIEHANKCGNQENADRFIQEIKIEIEYLAIETRQ